MNHKKCLNIFCLFHHKDWSHNFNIHQHLHLFRHHTWIFRCDSCQKTILLLHNHPFGFQSDDFYFALVVVRCCREIFLYKSDQRSEILDTWPACIFSFLTWADAVSHNTTWMPLGCLMFPWFGDTDRECTLHAGCSEDRETDKLSVKGQIAPM